MENKNQGEIQRASLSRMAGKEKSNREEKKERIEEC
jgi:hypothetical protein